MKAFKFFRAVIISSGLFLSACAGASSGHAVPAAGSAGSDKPLSEVVFTGSIEAMNGDQWLINGQTVRVDSATLQDGPFVVGDTVKVEATVAEDGTVVAQKVESPSAADLAETATSTPDVSSTGSPVASDKSATEAVGAVEAMTDASITVGGQTYAFAQGAKIKGTIEVGTIVKLHLLTNADGTLSVREVEIANPAQVSGNNSNNDNSNATNVNDNSSNNSNDDSSSVNSNGNDDNSSVNSNNKSSDDNGNGNVNDDNGNDDNGNSNSNDNNSNG